MPNVAITSAFENIPFAFWDIASNVVVPARNLRYSYPVVPQMFNVTGCASGNLDDDWPVFVQTVNCPTAGNVNLSISAAYMTLPLTVQIGGVTITTPIDLRGDNISLTLYILLPPGTGQGLTIQVLHIIMKWLMFVECIVRDGPHIDMVLNVVCRGRRTRLHR